MKTNDLTIEELAKMIRDSEYQQLGDGPGQELRRWTQIEKRLAEAYIELLKESRQ